MSIIASINYFILGEPATLIPASTVTPVTPIKTEVKVENGQKTSVAEMTKGKLLVMQSLEMS